MGFTFLNQEIGKYHAVIQILLLRFFMSPKEPVATLGYRINVLESLSILENLSRAYLS